MLQKSSIMSLFGKEKLVTMYCDMLRIRLFEEKVEQLFTQGEIPGSIHLCIGQEATAVGACAVLNTQDKILSTHRNHGHSIAKGSELNRMMAELLGRATGYCKGKGGSMHIADLGIGNLGANGIVGAGISIGTGVALASKMKQLGYVVVSFFGDGANNEGAFHEGLNLAAIWDLPIIFFCENNQYGLSKSIKEMVKVGHIADRSASYGIPGEVVDGNDLFQVIEAMGKAVERARSGEGPTLIEAKTYRWRGHSRSDPRKYRSREEEMDWQTNKDPIARYRAQLIREGVVTEEEAQEVESGVRTEVDAAAEFAKQSPMPPEETLEEDVYA